MPGGSPLFWCSSPARGGSPLFWCSSPRPLALAQYKVKSRRVLLFPRVAAAGHWLAAERLLAGRWPFAADSTASSTRSRCHCLRTRSTAAGQQGDGRCCGATCTTSMPAAARWPRSTRPAAVPHAHSEGRRPLLGRLCDSGLWAHLGARRAGLSSLSERADAQAERPTGHERTFGWPNAVSLSEWRRSLVFAGCEVHRAL